MCNTKHSLTARVWLTGCLIPLSLGAHSVTFSLGDIEGSFDSRLVVGSSWRMAGIDPHNVTPANFPGGTALSSTNDDGDLNFDKHDAFSTTIKGVHDLQLNYHNLGAFTRFNYWYDFTLSDQDVKHGHGPNGYLANTPLNDRQFSDQAQFSGVGLLDAFVFAQFVVADRPAEIRVGKQVVSWGESTFIMNGINAVNPVDVSAFRRPGAEIKEALLPVTMVYGSFALTESLNTEWFYQLDWAKTELDACGTFFSTSDVAADGCTLLTLSNQVPDAILAGMPVPQGVGALTRAADNEPGNSGQFGIAFHYFAEALNNTEFGLYYMNIHSRIPLLGVTTRNGFPQYFMAFPEDIELYGLSFNTNLGEWAVSGEISHRRDQPIQINGSEVISGFAAAFGLAAPTTFSPEVNPVGDTPGWDRVAVTQAQATLLRTFNRFAGASRLVLIGEVGVSHIHDDLSDHPYGRSTNYGLGLPNDDGFISQTSWGYRLRSSLRYEDVYKGIGVTPTLSWSQDVAGVSITGGAFNEGDKSVGLSLKADYIDTYDVTLSYRNFFGGRFNSLSDRDFLALSAGVSF